MYSVDTITPAAARVDVPARGKIRLFYRPDYVCDVLEAGLRNTFDVLRPQRIRDALIACGTACADEFIAAPALSGDDLLLVHSAACVELIRQPSTLAHHFWIDAGVVAEARAQWTHLP